MGVTGECSNVGNLERRGFLIVTRSTQARSRQKGGHFVVREEEGVWWRPLLQLLQEHPQHLCNDYTMSRRLSVVPFSLSLSLWMLVFLPLPKAFSWKESLQARFSLSTLYCCGTWKREKKTSCRRLRFWSSHALRDIIVWFYFYSFQKLKTIVGSCFFGSRRIIEITEVQSVAMLGFHKFCCHVLEFTNSVFSDKKKG